MQKSKVSVILPTFNRAGLIGETLDSLLAQTRRPDEILVIDDGSSDATAEVLGSYDDALTVHRQENAGKAVALNRALGMVSGDLVWIADDDDILLPHACAALAGALEDDPGLGFCAGRHVDFTVDPASGEKVLRDPGYMRDSEPGRIFPDLLEGCHIFQPGLMVRRSVYDAVGPFRSDLMRSQDYEMLLRIARHHHGRQLDEIVFWHREHDGQRGQAGQQFSAGENANRWAAFNGQIFTELLADLGDHELFSEAEWAETPAERRDRLALIARGTVQGRQRMWAQALDSFAAAARSDASPLSAGERARVARATLSSLGSPELILDAGLQASLRTLKLLGPAGSEIRRVLRRSMLWQLRLAAQKRDVRTGSAMIGFLARS